MPEITPIMPEGTITKQAVTSKASELLRQAQTLVPQKDNPSPAAEPENVPSPSPTQQSGSDKTDAEKKVFRQRLAQENAKRQFEAERKQLENEKRQLELDRAQSRKWQEANDLAKQGRYTEAAEKAGITYDQLTQQILNGGQVPPKAIAEQTAAELVEKRFEAFKKEQEENQKKAVTTQLEEARKIMFNEAKHLVDSSDKFPLAKDAGAYQDVVRLIESEFHRTGRIIPVEDAINRWEEDALSGLEELFKIEKVRQRLAGKESPNKPEAPVRQAPREEAPRTLSQKTMASVPKPQSETPEERRQRAIDAFYGRLP